ncbi:uncharacterized protein [Miscanthus floridulus]|uniref:uncharacterized protein n=1 Tax=Miscanthus floridulus TaxID=154761 RepID=UPI0034591614
MPLGPASACCSSSPFNVAATAPEPPRAGIPAVPRGTSSSTRSAPVPGAAASPLLVPAAPPLPLAPLVLRCPAVQALQRLAPPRLCGSRLVTMAAATVPRRAGSVALGRASRALPGVRTTIAPCARHCPGPCQAQLHSHRGSSFGRAGVAVASHPRPIVANAREHACRRGCCEPSSSSTASVAPIGGLIVRTYGSPSPLAKRTPPPPCHAPKRPAVDLFGPCVARPRCGHASCRASTNASLSQYHAASTAHSRLCRGLLLGFAAGRWLCSVRSVLGKKMR